MPLTQVKGEFRSILIDLKTLGNVGHYLGPVIVEGNQWLIANGPTNPASVKRSLESGTPNTAISADHLEWFDNQRVRWQALFDRRQRSRRDKISQFRRFLVLLRSRGSRKRECRNKRDHAIFKSFHFTPPSLILWPRSKALLHRFRPEQSTKLL